MRMSDRSACSATSWSAGGGGRAAEAGAGVPLMFPIKGAAAEGADVPPIATPAWDAERALAALNITEVPFDATNGHLLGYARVPLDSPYRRRDRLQ